MRGAPRLVTVAHGTRWAPGNRVARVITRRAARRWGLDATASYVELAEPLLTSVLAEDPERPTVVVPLLLSTGYHMQRDLPDALTAGARLAPALGPHPLLAEVMARRLEQAGATRGRPVVMVAAGSNRPDSVPDVRQAARLLSKRWGAPVVPATLAGLGTPLAEAVAAVRRDRGDDAAVSPYLLAPGHFHDKLVAEADALGVAAVADVIGNHPLVSDLVVRRYRTLSAGLRAA